MQGNIEYVMMFAMRFSCQPNLYGPMSESCVWGEEGGGALALSERVKLKGQRETSFLTATLSSLETSF